MMNTQTIATIKATTKTLKGFAREVPEMTSAAMRGAWGKDSLSNYLAWVNDWLLRLMCWSFGIQYPLSGPFRQDTKVT